MIRHLQPLICLLAAAALCQCSSGGKKKEEKNDVAGMTLAQRSMQKPDQNRRSSYEKYITNSRSKGNAGSHFQKQMHHSKSFNGGNSYAGQKQFKTSQSWFSRSKSRSSDMTYSLGGKQAVESKSAFETQASRFADQSAREGSSMFRDGGNVFETGSALTRDERRVRKPLIIENYNDRAEGKKSAYTEDEVKKLLNRN